VAELETYFNLRDRTVGSMQPKPHLYAAPPRE
jgi:hypothetical protein